MNKFQVGVLTTLISIAVVLLSTQNNSVHDPMSEKWQQWKQENSMKFNQDIELYRKMIFV
jgi:hypothetical protein